MTDKNTLTGKQAKVLEFIEAEISRSGRSPTFRDIAKALGYDAVGTVQDHVRALIKKGYLLKEEGVARGIQLAHRAASIDVPILGMVPAGHPLEAMENVLGSISAPAKWKGDLYALKVTGDSMVEAGILDGDYVIVRKQHQAEQGDIVVALLDGEATVKFLDRKNGRVRLLPANPRYAPIELTHSAESVIHGRVVSVQRYY